MTACKIETFAVSMDHNGNYAGTTQSQCMTHGWTFQRGVGVVSSDMCPIGRIEHATDVAIEKIQQATTTKADIDPPFRIKQKW